MKTILLILLLLTSILSGQNQTTFSLAVYYNYITSSKLFLQPNSTDPFIRGTHETLDGIYSYSLEIRFKIMESIYLGLGTELVEKTIDNYNFAIAGRWAVIKDGYRMIPVEASIYYILPFSTDKFNFFMGGGGGLYFGNHIRQIGDVSVDLDKIEYGYGIHAIVGMEYSINKYLSIRGQMRFRDAEFEVKSKYTKRIVNYYGNSYLLSSETFSSKVNVDGVTFMMGLVFNL